MGIKGIEKIAGVTGLDGSGKQTLTYEAAANLAFAENIYIDEKEYEGKEVSVIVTSFPEYTFLGNLIRRSFSDVGDQFFSDHGLDYIQELKLRKSLFAIDRLITISAIKSFTQSHDNRKYLWLSDRLDEDQVNTIAYVLNKHGRQDEFEKFLPDVLDADYFLRQIIEPTSIICFPSKVENLAQFNGTRQVDSEDNYENIDAQTLADRGYEWVANNLPNNYKIVTQNDDGSWRNKEELVAELLAKIGVRTQGKIERFGTSRGNLRSEMWSAMTDRKVYHFGVAEIFMEMFPILKHTSNYRAFEELHNYASEWHLCNFADIEYIRERHKDWEILPNVMTQDKKAVMRILEENIARIAGVMITDLRTSNKFKQSIDPYILETALPALFGEYTDGYLMKYITYLSEHAWECISYPEIIRDIAPWVTKYE